MATLRRLRQKAYDSALNRAASQDKPPIVRMLPSPTAVIALVIALIVAVVFSLMRLNAFSTDAILEDAAGSVKGKVSEQSGSDPEGAPGSSGGPGGGADDGVGSGGSGGRGEDTSVTGMADGSSGETGTLMVQVTGAVKNPSVVTVRAGARGVDAVEAAGGLSKDASLSSVNLAQPVVDGQHIHVLTQAEVEARVVPGQSGVGGLGGGGQASSGGAGSLATGAEPGGTGSGAGGAGSGAGSAGSGAGGAGFGIGDCIDLRVADQMSLQALPGVGPALAERIVTYRSENGLENPEDVQNVSGIGPKTYAGFKDMLCR